MEWIKYRTIKIAMVSSQLNCICSPINHATKNTGKILNDASLNDMWTLRTPNGEFPGYALGFFDGQTWLENLARFRLEEEGVSSNAFPIPAAWFHGGSGAGGYSILFVYPDDDLVISMASNTQAGGNLIMLDVHAIAEPFLERSRE